MFLIEIFLFVTFCNLAQQVNLNLFAEDDCSKGCVKITKGAEKSENFQLNGVVNVPKHVALHSITFKGNF